MAADHLRRAAGRRQRSQVGRASSLTSVRQRTLAAVARISIVIYSQAIA